MGVVGRSDKLPEPGRLSGRCPDPVCLDAVCLDPVCVGPVCVCALAAWTPSRLSGLSSVALKRLYRDVGTR